MAIRKCTGPPFNHDPESVSGGGLDFVTSDPMMKAAVWRCRQLSGELAEAEHQLSEMQRIETARFRTMRRDIRMIRRDARLIREAMKKGE